MGTTTDLNTLAEAANYVREISRNPKTMGDEVQIRELDTRANTQTRRASTSEAKNHCFIFAISLSNLQLFW